VGDRIFCDDKTCLIREPLAGLNRCYLAPAAAAKLAAAAKSLNARDPALRLRVWDCYRPIDVQIEMFQRVANPEWVAEPKPPRYGGHNRGVAVDVTIERDGVALDMGSAFDLFTKVSNYDAKGISPAAAANRKLLRDLMIEAGLRPYDGEWWHFSLPAAEQADLKALNFPL
jgi:D-alanyl-D-alanine dipeptidase